MATLFNTKIKDTYQSLLKLEDNTILTTTVKNVTDGLGNASPLYMSTTRIGIGTTTPTAKFEIVDSAGSTGNALLISHPSAPATLSYNPTASALTLSKGYSYLAINTFGGGSNALTLGSGGPHGYLDLKENGTTYTYLTGTSTGNAGYSYFLSQLGVGTATTLGAKLSIKGSGSTSATNSLLVQNSNGNNALQIRDDLSILTGNGFLIDSGNGNRIFTGGQLTLQSNNTTQAIKFDGIPYAMNNNSTFISVAGANTLYLQTAGSMSIFGITGRYVLASGSATINCFAIDGNLDASSSTSNGLTRGLYINQPLINNTSGYRYTAIETVTGNVLLGTTSGFVGIGTSNPTSKLEVIGATRISSTLNVGGDGSTGSSYSSGFIAYDTGNGYAHSLIHAQAAQLFLFANPQGFAIAGYEPASSGLSASNLAFMTSSSTRMKILSNGNVLIGTTTNAGYKLDVNGTVRIQNTLNFNSNFEIASGPVICGYYRAPGNGPGQVFVENMQAGQIPFQFRSGYGLSASKSFLNIGGRSIFNINIGLGDPNASNLDASVLLLDGTHNVTSGTGTTIRGIYYNPTITSLTGVVAHRAIETTSGDIVFNGGNVGIGTSSPTNPLDIAYSPGRLISFKPRTGYLDFGQIVFSSVTGAEIISSGSIGLGPSDTYKTLILGNGITSKITTPGSTKYDGFGNQSPATLAGSTNQPFLFTSTIADGNIDGFIFENTSSGSRNLFKVIQNNTTLLTLNPNGNLLVGTTSDAGYKLNVNGTAFVSELITTGGMVKHNPYTVGVRALEIYSGIGHGGNTGVWASMYSTGVYGNGFDGYIGTQGYGVIGDPTNNAAAQYVNNIGVAGGATLSNATGVYGTSGLFGKATSFRNASAALEVNSTTHGFLPPRMTAAQRSALTTITGFGTITGGSGYVDGTYYNIVLTGGGGQNGYARITVSGGTVTSVILEPWIGGLSGGFGYTNGASVSASNTQLGGSGAGFSVIINASTPVGMMVYQTDATEGLYIYKSTGWTFIA